MHYRKWSDQLDDLRDLWELLDANGTRLSIREIALRLHRTESAIITHAQRLGLPALVRIGAPGKKHTQSDSCIKLKCLTCSRPFLSTDRVYNRICKGCRESTLWTTGGDLTLRTIGGH